MKGLAIKKSRAIFNRLDKEGPSDTWATQSVGKTTPLLTLAVLTPCTANIFRARALTNLTSHPRVTRICT